MTHEWQANLVSGGGNDLWDVFCRWADDNSIGAHQDDWREWWTCFQAGAACGETPWREFAEMVEGKNWTNHTEQRSEQLSAAATLRLMPQHLLRAQIRDNFQ